MNNQYCALHVPAQYRDGVNCFECGVRLVRDSVTMTYHTLRGVVRSKDDNSETQDQADARSQAIPEGDDSVDTVIDDARIGTLA